MVYCYVCKSFADYEYDIALTNGDFLHDSCLIKLQIREDEIESILRKQSPQMLLSLFCTDRSCQDCQKMRKTRII